MNNLARTNIVSKEASTVSALLFELEEDHRIGQEMCALFEKKNRTPQEEDTLASLVYTYYVQHLHLRKKSYG